jgi:hypothetical protein
MLISDEQIPTISQVGSIAAAGIGLAMLGSAGAGWPAGDVPPRPWPTCPLAVWAGSSANERAWVHHRGTRRDASDGTDDLENP